MQDINALLAGPVLRITSLAAESIIPKIPGRSWNQVTLTGGALSRMGAITNVEKPSRLSLDHWRCVAWNQDDIRVMIGLGGNLMWPA